MTLVTRARIEERRALAAPGAPFAGLYEGLAAELEPLVGRSPYVPEQKALLSRSGGRCADDGTTLEFDPLSPHHHRCPACGRTYAGELHHRAWITWYQLWLAERAVHAATFHALRGEQRHREVAERILEAYSDRYLAYPNVDNVLGPTRPFFSTYLESIWLLQLCVASSLLEGVATQLVDRVRDRIVEPSRRLIAEFDEGRSNRQVWNNAALLAAASLCGDRDAIGPAALGRSGLVAHLESALLPDGSWYEGENYHQFALRGLWYGVMLAENAGIELPGPLLDRFHRAFGVPFTTALPDFTMPSRKDSQYAVSLRQWRLAELTELGYARTGDAALRRALARCYEPGHPRRDTGRSRSAADAERNSPSGALTREDLSWRALLFAVPRLPDTMEGSLRSAHLPAQGYAVFRREPEVYVGFDYGQTGGGHGHPDRLNVTLYQGDVRWLDDLGTGSYVDPSLHWYRSTLAHNAPLMNGRSQPMVDGVLRAYDEREGMGWAAASLHMPPGDATLERAIVVATDYLVDELTWSSDAAFIDLPLHLEGEANVALSSAPLDGGSALEDGFAFLTDVRAADVRAGQVVRIEGERKGKRLVAHLVSTSDARLYDATAPGQPAAESRRFFLMRARATEGRIRSVIAWTQPIEITLTGDQLQVACGRGERHLHRRDETGWHVELHAGAARSGIDLAGVVSATESAAAAEQTPAPRDLREGEVLRFDLGRAHYRRSELSWTDAGAPRAAVSIARAGSGLVLTAEVRAGDVVFPAADASNDFDNEHPDTMGAGLQLYLRMRQKTGAWALVPEQGASVRVRAIDQDSEVESPRATWQAAPGGGYVVRAHVPLPKDARAGEPFQMDLYINETVAGRVRRRGQLVLTGAHGEWVYLRGDRHETDRWLTLRLA